MLANFLRAHKKQLDVSDPFFDNVTLLLNLNGTDGSTSILDDSNISNPITVYGSANITTSISKFGSGSLEIQADPSYLTAPYTSANFSWFADSITIEAFVYADDWSTWSNTAGASPTPKSNMVGNATPTGTSNYWSFGPDANGNLRFFYYTGSEQHVVSPSTISTGVWHHIAMTYDGSNIRLFIDGNLEITSSIIGGPQQSPGVPLTIARVVNSNLIGYLDSIRITKGIARYLASFTPPSEEFPSS